jgi:hypothetical protein
MKTQFLLGLTIYSVVLVPLAWTQGPSKVSPSILSDARVQVELGADHEFVPVSTERLHSTVALALFGRTSTPEDVVLELVADDALGVGTAIPGWSSREEVFDFIPLDRDDLPPEEISRRLSEQKFSPEQQRIMEDPATRISFSTSILTSTQGAVVGYSAVITYGDSRAGRKRYLVPLATFSCEDSEAVILPGLISSGAVSSTSSSLLVVGGHSFPGGSIAIRPSVLKCTLLTAACISLFALTGAACLSLCATLNPLCVVCIIGAFGTARVCCSACNCWRQRGASIFCGC